MTIATDEQIQDLANTIALQADALASGKIDADALFAHVRRIADNAETLKAWTTDRQVWPATPERKIAVEAVAAVEASGVLDNIEQRELDLIDSTPARVRVSPKDQSNHALARSSALLTQMQIEDLDAGPGYCTGCGVTFRGAAGLRAHQSQKFIALSCKGL